jgi:hypothetical protein
VNYVQLTFSPVLTLATNSTAVITIGGSAF